MEQINEPSQLRHPSHRQALDSVLARASADFRYVEMDSSDIDLNFVMKKKYRVAKRDIVELSIDSLQKHYAVEHWTDRIFFRQAIKSHKEPGGLGKFWVNTLAWTILLQIAFSALWLYFCTSVVESTTSSISFF